VYLKLVREIAIGNSDRIGTVVYIHRLHGRHTGSEGIDFTLSEVDEMKNYIHSSSIDLMTNE
jgi:hypothetical protein